MRLDDYAERDGKRVWLTAEEIETVVEEAETPVQEAAFRLAGQAGLRRAEVVSVTYEDFQHAPDGFVRIWNDYAKKGKYREAPVPDELSTIARTLSHGQTLETAIVDVHGTTVYRWVRKAAERLEATTDDPGWQYLDVHDLRRSWGGHLLWDCGVSPMAVMEFGGWSDWETFEQHYMGEMTPRAMDRERGKIDFMSGSPGEEVVFNPSHPAAAETYGQR
jgi:integrase